MFSTEQRSQIMRLIRSKNTKPEIAVRKLVHRLGYRFRLHTPGMPGRPDLTFPRLRSVIFIHGCFWHSHQAAHCKVRPPKSNAIYWQPKLARNQARDRSAQDALHRLGWRVLVVWECEIKDMETLAVTLKQFLAEGER